MLQRIKTQISIYGTYIKRGLLFANIFLMLRAVQVLVKYTTIIESTELIKAQTAKVEEEIAYINHYQLKFLDSDHAKFFLAHENNILGADETVIVFKAPKAEAESEPLLPSEIKETPWESWKAFFREKRPQ